MGMHQVKVYIPNSDWNPDTRTVNICCESDNDLQARDSAIWKLAEAEPAPRDLLDPWGHKGLRGLQDQRGRQGQPVHKEFKAPRELQDLQDLLVQPVPRAPWGQQGLREPPVLWDQQGPPG